MTVVVIPLDGGTHGGRAEKKKSLLRNGLRDAGLGASLALPST